MLVQRQKVSCLPVGGKEKAIGGQDASDLFTA